MDGCCNWRCSQVDYRTGNCKLTACINRPVILILNSQTTNYPSINNRTVPIGYSYLMPTAIYTSLPYVTNAYRIEEVIS